MDDDGDLAIVAARDGVAASGRSNRSRRPAAGVHLETSIARRGGRGTVSARQKRLWFPSPPSSRASSARETGLRKQEKRGTRKKLSRVFIAAA